MRVQNEYESNVSFRNAIHGNIDDFLTRYLSRFAQEDINHERAFSLCRQGISHCGRQMLCSFRVNIDGRRATRAAGGILVALGLGTSAFRLPWRAVVVIAFCFSHKHLC